MSVPMKQRKASFLRPPPDSLLAAEPMLQYLMGERIGYQIIGISIQVDPAHHMLPLLVEQADKIDKRKPILFRPVPQIRMSRA